MRCRKPIACSTAQNATVHDSRAGGQRPAELRPRCLLVSRPRRELQWPPPNGTAVMGAQALVPPAPAALSPCSATSRAAAASRSVAPTMNGRPHRSARPSRTTTPNGGYTDQTSHQDPAPEIRFRVTASVSSVNSATLAPDDAQRRESGLDHARSRMAKRKRGLRARVTLVLVPCERPRALAQTPALVQKRQ